MNYHFKWYKYIGVLIRVFFDEGAWIAKSFTGNICTQGNTKQEALDSFERVVLGQIHLDKECKNHTESFWQYRIKGWLKR